MITWSKHSRRIEPMTRSTYARCQGGPLYRFHQRQANLRIIEICEIKTVPYAPLSHPFVERLTGTLRRECLDLLLFWTATDLELKLTAFMDTTTDIELTLDSKDELRWKCRSVNALISSRTNG